MIPLLRIKLALWAFLAFSAGLIAADVYRYLPLWHAQYAGWQMERAIGRVEAARGGL